MAKGIVTFHLKRFWEYPDGRTVDLYEEIKAGRKTSEFRDWTDYWVDRLYRRTRDKNNPYIPILRPKVKRAWFVVGYPKGNLPRLEADIKNIVVHSDENGYAEQVEIQLENVVEVTE